MNLPHGLIPYRNVSKNKDSKRLDLMADFETITDPLDCRVWAWGMANIYTAETLDSVKIGGNLESFLDAIQYFNANIYFHNLKFDGHFIIDYIMKNGYTYIHNDENIKVGTFKMLMSDMGKLFSITIKWKSGFTTELRDSLKKLPMSISRVAESFGYETTKGDLDYDAYRAPDHVATPEERDYIARDVLIAAKAMREVLDAGMKKLTVASDALAEYKALTGKDHFTRLFPILPEIMDTEIRRAYRGGFTYSDPRYRSKKVGAGIVLDVNSLYPSVMRKELLPYGYPEYVSGKVEPTERKPLTIFSVTFVAKLKSNHIPCIQIKSSNIFSPTDYLTEIAEPTTIMTTNVDWKLYNDHYDITVLAYGGGWRFKATAGLFDGYIDKWSEIKAKESGGKREIAKLHLNSLYGKFATNPNVTSKYPILDDDGAVKYKRGADEKRDPIYTAMGVFITSYARDLTIRAAQANYNIFAYADTDSLHLISDEWVIGKDEFGKDTLLNPPSGIEVHAKKLGAWKFEYSFTEAFYIRPKAYMELMPNGEYVTRIAGLPERVSEALTFDDLVDGKVLHGKLNPKSVPGGVVLIDVPFQLKL